MATVSRDRQRAFADVLVARAGLLDGGYRADRPLEQRILLDRAARWRGGSVGNVVSEDDLRAEREALAAEVGPRREVLQRRGSEALKGVLAAAERALATDWENPSREVMADLGKALEDSGRALSDLARPGGVMDRLEAAERVLAEGGE